MKKSGDKLINFYEVIDKKYLEKKLKNPNKSIHGLDLPFRMVIVGASGSGKTSTALNIINIFGCFDYIRVITKNADEPLYNWLSEKGKKDKDIIITEGIDTIPSVDEFDKKLNNLVIIDDLVLEKNQQSVDDFYIRCRKLNVSVIYISQSYFLINKVIRQNCNYIIIKKFGSVKDVQALMRDYSFGVDKKKLMEIYKFCLEGSFNNFMLIDVFDTDHKFRKNWTKLDID